MPSGQYDRPFWSRVNKNGPVPEHRKDLGPCWVWLGAKNQYGYGRMIQNGRQILVHRMLYEKYIGPIRIETDHLCRNRSCVNPSHLEDVTRRENSLRGMSPMIITHRTKRCQRGHTDFYSRGGDHIQCKICKLESNRRYREKRAKEN